MQYYFFLKKKILRCNLKLKRLAKREQNTETHQPPAERSIVKLLIMSTRATERPFDHQGMCRQSDFLPKHKLHTLNTHVETNNKYFQTGHGSLNGLHSHHDSALKHLMRDYPQEV